MKKSELRQLIKEEIKKSKRLPDKVEVRRIAGTNRYIRVTVFKDGEELDRFESRTPLLDFENKYGELEDLSNKGVKIDEYEVDRD